MGQEIDTKQRMREGGGSCLLPSLLLLLLLDDAFARQYAARSSIGSSVAFDRQGPQLRQWPHWYDVPPYTPVIYRCTFPHSPSLVCVDRFLLLIHIALVLTAVVLFVIGVSVSVRAGFEIENDSILFEQSTNATAPRPNMRRTMELQVSMHGAYWNNRSMLVDDFFGLTMEAWGIGTDPDSFMVLDNDETCIMMYVRPHD